MTYRHIEVQPMTGGLGAELFGVDLSKPLSDDQFDEIHQALLDFIFIALPDQKLTPENFGAFGSRFGELEDETFIPKLEGHKGIHQFRGVSGDRLTTQNLGWHVDHSYKEVPSMGAMLYAVDVPDFGGDTLFVNQYKAYEALSPRMKNIIGELEGIHDVLHYGMQSGLFPLDKAESFGRLQKMRERLPQVTHPLVCTHPETGRKYIYVNQCWTVGIEGLNTDESRGILEFLFRHTTQPRFQCRFRWHNGTLGMWDNRCALHSGIPDYAGKRAMYRLSIEGTWKPA
jgi:taurine dioxygenase